MRWDKLFDDLESQLEQELGTEEIELAAEDERLRLARLSLRDRMVALQRADQLLSLLLIDGTRLSLSADTFGRDWCSGAIEPRRQQCLLPLTAVAALLLPVPRAAESLAEPATAERGERLSARLGFGFVLRDLCRRRHPVTVSTLDGSLHGTIDRIGRDHLDLAVHEPGVARRDSAVSELRVIPLARIVMVRL